MAHTSVDKVIALDLLPAALFYAEDRGFHVFPCRWITESKDREAKAPLITNGCHGATTDADTITSWWTRWPNAAIGINCGRSVLVVIDCDTGKPLPEPYASQPGITDGEDVLAHQCGEGKFPWTRSVRTPSGGVHYYYVAPTGGEPIKPSVGRIGPMVDVRAGESYVIAAGSWADGKPYTMLDPQPIQPLPNRLAVLARGSECRARGHANLPIATPQPMANGDAYHALKVLVDFVLDAPVGERNVRLHWAACRVGDDITRGRYTRGQGEGALAQAATSVGLSAHEAHRTIASALRAAS